MSTTPQHVLDALARVCGYHDGPDCEHCAEAIKHRLGKFGMTPEQLLADINLYDTDYPEWERQVRERIARRHEKAEESATRATDSAELPSLRDLAAQALHRVDCGCKHPDDHTPEVWPYYEEMADAVLAVIDEETP